MVIEPSSFLLLTYFLFNDAVTNAVIAQHRMRYLGLHKNTSEWMSWRSWCSSTTIVSDYGLNDREIRVLSPAEAKRFSSSLCVQSGSGAHPASCTMGTGGPFPRGLSAAGAWRWTLTPI